uniref:DDB1 and CUL4 associated factor 5 n=1 Tax=Molossus molossus TaxID=27622 RepID=A0A7J8JS39_MOLMO|nr:DDB1 and CUL4 associated factor 5 [Molossus molossus]
MELYSGEQAFQTHLPEKKPEKGGLNNGRPVSYEHAKTKRGRNNFQVESAQLQAQKTGSNHCALLGYQVLGLLTNDPMSMMRTNGSTGAEDFSKDVISPS